MTLPHTHMLQGGLILIFASWPQEWFEAHACHIASVSPGA